MQPRIVYDKNGFLSAENIASADWEQVVFYKEVLEKRSVIFPDGRFCWKLNPEASQNGMTYHKGKLLIEAIANNPEITILSLSGSYNRYEVKALRRLYESCLRLQIELTDPELLATASKRLLTLFTPERPLLLNREEIPISNVLIRLVKAKSVKFVNPQMYFVLSPDASLNQKFLKACPAAQNLAGSCTILFEVDWKRFGALLNLFKENLNLIEGRFSIRHYEAVQERGLWCFVRANFKSGSFSLKNFKCEKISDFFDPDEFVTTFTLFFPERKLQMAQRERKLQSALFVLGFLRANRTNANNVDVDKLAEKIVGLASDTDLRVNVEPQVVPRVKGFTK